MKSNPANSAVFNLWRERRRRLMIRAVALGLAVGLFAVLFQFLLIKTEKLNHYLAYLASENLLMTLLFPVFCSLLAASAAYLTEKFAPEASGSGIPHAKGVIAGIYSLRALPIIFTKIIAGVLAIASGLSLGREGPTVQIGAACGRILSGISQVSKRSLSLMIAAGGGAGLAAAFNAPLAGFIFVMEELKREMSGATYATSLLTSICAVAVSRIIYGQNPAFLLSDPGIIPMTTIPFVIIIGLSGSLAGVFFNKLILKLIRLRISLNKPTYYTAALAGLAGGLLLLFFPQLTGGGHNLTHELLQGNHVHAMKAAENFGLMAGKLFFTALCFVSGVPGGIFMPLLVIGSLMGNAYGIIFQPLFGDIGNLPAIFSLLGMGAVLTGSVRAPLTGCVLIIEMTSEYSLLYPLLISAFASYLLAEYLQDTPIYDALLEMDLHKGQNPPSYDSEVIPVEFTIEPHSSLDGKRLNEFDLPGNTLIISVDRAGKSFLPRGNTTLFAGDVITIAVEGADKRENLKFFKRATRGNRE